MESIEYDVVIAGSGVAGNICAIKLQQAGLNVLLVDRRRSHLEHKTLCTHFIQPFSVPVLHKLGLTDLLSSENSVETKAAFLVPGGVIDPEGGYGDGGTEHTHSAYNIERRVMDPMLRHVALDFGVSLKMNTSLSEFEVIKGGYRITLTEQGQKRYVTCRQVIAADGRKSRLAKVLNAETQLYANDRAAYFCYCNGIPQTGDKRSLFSLKNNEMSFLYPLIEGRTLLSVYIQKSRAELWGLSGSSFDKLMEIFQIHLPFIDFSQAELDSRILSYKQYENQVRPPVCEGVPFIGDAVISIDPMSGTGCGFAIKSADLLGDAILQHGIASKDERYTSMQFYEQSFNAFFPSHIKGIVADSLVSKSEKTVTNTFNVILNDLKLQRLYLDLTARLITPEQFQKRYLMSVAKQMSKAKRALA